MRGERRGASSAMKSATKEREAKLAADEGILSMRGTPRSHSTPELGDLFVVHFGALRRRGLRSWGWTENALASKGWNDDGCSEM